MSTANVSWMSSLPLIALPSCRLASSSAHDRYICQEVESLDIQSKAQPVCAAEPMMAGFVCGLLRLVDTIRASTGPTAFLRSRNRSSNSPNWSPLTFRFLEVRICTGLYIFLYEFTCFSTSIRDPSRGGAAGGFSWVAHNRQVAHNGHFPFLGVVCSCVALVEVGVGICIYIDGP